MIGRLSRKSMSRKIKRQSRYKISNTSSFNYSATSGITGISSLSKEPVELLQISEGSLKSSLHDFKNNLNKYLPYKESYSMSATLFVSLVSSSEHSILFFSEDTSQWIVLGLSIASAIAGIYLHHKTNKNKPDVDAVVQEIKAKCSNKISIQYTPPSS